MQPAACRAQGQRRRTAVARGSPGPEWGGAAPGRRLMTRRGRQGSRHFLEPPAGAARRTQRRSRDPAAAAMSHQTGIQGNGARRGPWGRGSREAQPGRAGCGSGRAGVGPGARGGGLAGRAGPWRLSALPCPGCSRPVSLPARPGRRHVADGPEIRRSEGTRFARRRW